MPGLLEPLLSQMWMSVRGCGWILYVSFCAFDLGSGIGRGGGWLIGMFALFAILTGTRAELSFRSMGDMGLSVPSHLCIIVFGSINFSYLATKLLAKFLFERKYMKFDITKSGSSTTVQINGANFVLGKHWFWETFSENWEVDTQNFFTTNIVRDTDYLDLGGGDWHHSNDGYSAWRKDI